MTALIGRSVAATTLKVLLSGRASATNITDAEEPTDTIQDVSASTPGESRLVSWNGKGSGCSYLRTRALIAMQTMPKILSIGHFPLNASLRLF
jgi:hypothetical protein